MTVLDPTAWPTEGFSFGGDYNPEQWTPEVWQEDARLMKEAGINLVTLGSFSWGLFEPAEGEYDWSALDEIFDLLHEHGVSIDIGTPSAAPPQWLHEKHPEILPVNLDMRQQWPGARLGWCPSSPVFRAYAVKMVSELASRYADHPAVVMWHISNELGGGNGRCYCDVSAEAFRGWLRARYGNIAAVNEAWGTGFWGHFYTDFAQILPPRGDEGKNPSLQLDFDRFSSDEHLAHFFAEREAIRAFSPELPITTNFMVGQNASIVDYARWAPHMDLVSNDHYTQSIDPFSDQDIAFSGDRMRALTVDRTPWFLMEHSTGGASWQPRNRAKRPGELVRNSLSHVARGSDSAMFFQFRASKAGAEQFHSAMVPHAGTNTRIWREVLELGAHLRSIREVQGSRVEPARVAIIFDDTAGWAMNKGMKPHNGLRYGSQARAWHLAFWNQNVLVDVVPPWSNLDEYDVVIVPHLFLVSDDDARNISSVAERGGTLVVTWMSGVVDDTNQVRLGGYPGAFREVLGAWSEELMPVLIDGELQLDNGWAVNEWSEAVHADDAEIFARYGAGELAGEAAITRRHVGHGHAWYVSAGLAQESLNELVQQLITDNTVEPVISGAPAGVEAVRRQSVDTDYVFLLNNTAEAQTLSDIAGVDLLSGDTLTDTVEIPAGGVRVVKQPRTSGITDEPRSDAR